VPLRLGAHQHFAFGAGALVQLQHPLGRAQRLRRHFEQFVRREEVERLLKREVRYRRQLHGDIGRRGAIAASAHRLQPELRLPAGAERRRPRGAQRGQRVLRTRARLQIAARHHADALVLQAAYAYEQARPWNDRWPEL